MLPLSVLVVEDNEAFQRFICSVLQERAELQVSGQAADGLEAVQKAEGLQPDLILLDIGLPKLDGLEAGRRIRKVSPSSKIVFVSQESSQDVIREALSFGAQGYIPKTRAQDLLTAIDAVLSGKRFISSGLEFSEDNPVATNELERAETESKRALAAPRESEELFHLVANTAPVMIWMSDVDKVCTYINQRWLEFTGRSSELELASGWVGGIHPEDAPKCLGIYTQSFDRREPFRMEYRLRRHDGEYRWILDHGVPRFNADGSFAGYIGSGIDVTDRKLAEEALQKSDERLRLAMESGKSVGWDWDVKSGRDSLFGDLQSIFGIPAEVYDGRVEDFHRFVHPEDRRRVVEAVKYAMQTHQPYAAEFRLRWPDGTVRWLAARGKFHYSKDGDAERMLGMAVDITDRKLAEDKLKEYERAVEGSEEMIVVVDREYRYLVANNKFLKMRNMTREQVVGRFAYEVLNNGVFESVVKQRLDECFQGKVVRYETKYTYPEIGERDVLISYFPIEGSTGVDRVACIIQDITERKLAEKALRDSEERFRLAVQAGKMYAFKWDALTNVIERSGDPAQIVGGDGLMRASSQQVWAQVHPDDRERLKELAANLTPEEAEFRISHRMIREDGEVIWVERNCRAHFDERRRMLRIVGMVADVTDRKRTEEALAKSEERLRLAQQAGRVGTFEWNIRTGVNTWTPELEAMYGLSPGSFGGTQAAFEALVHSDDRAEVIEANVVAMKTGQPTNGEWRAVWPDGSVHWIVGRWQVFKDESGEPSRMIGVNIEVTERKMAEQALRESEQRFRLAAQTGKMYSFEWDVTTDVVVRSPERVKVLGATGPLRSSHQQFVDSIYADDRPKFIATIAGLTPEKPTADVVYRVRGSDGELVWLKSSGRAFFDPEGKMLRLIGMVADITDLKRAEEALSEMTQKLIEAQEQERSRIARELHDDINQKLALLAIKLESLKQGVPGSAVELAQQISEASKQIGDVGKDIQAISHRLHSPKLEYLGLAVAAKSFCREFSDQQKVEISFQSENIPKGLPQEIAVCLFRVLQEALQNATKHSRSRQFQVSLKARMNEIELTVRDSGVGFDPVAALKGRGLGLTSMTERLKLVDGELSIVSQVGHCSTIRARVPLRSGMSAGGIG